MSMRVVPWSAALVLSLGGAACTKKKVEPEAKDQAAYREAYAAWLSDLESRLGAGA